MVAKEKQPSTEKWKLHNWKIHLQKVSIFKSYTQKTNIANRKQNKKNFIFCSKAPKYFLKKLKPPNSFPFAFRQRFHQTLRKQIRNIEVKEKASENSWNAKRFVSKVSSSSKFAFLQFENIFKKIIMTRIYKDLLVI